jgi:hypothetical protein
MRILKLHEPTGHAYWSQGMYGIELPNGERVDKSKYLPTAASHRVYWDNQGVWVQACACGSGYGKVDMNVPPVLVVSRNQYDDIEIVGEQLKMSDTLKQDLKDNHIL